MAKVYKSTYISKEHHKLLNYMVLIIGKDNLRKESKTSLLERLVLAYANQMVNLVNDDAERGKLLELINEAHKQPTKQTQYKS